MYFAGGKGINQNASYQLVVFKSYNREITKICQELFLSVDAVNR